MNNQDLKKLKTNLEGKWIDVFCDIGSEQLAKAAAGFIAGKRTQKGVYCPQHGGKSGEAFKLLKDADVTGGSVCNTCCVFPDGFATLMFANHWDFPTALNAVSQWAWDRSFTPHNATKLSQQRQQRAHQQRQADKQESQRLIEKYQRIWQQAIALTDANAQPAQRYFQKRGVGDMLASIGHCKFHPRLAYFDDEKGVSYHPAVVALITQPDDKVKNLHVTYLTSEGEKAKVSHPKKQLSAIPERNQSGGAVRLMDATHTDTLVVSEGRENGLSWIKMHGGILWECINTAMLSHFLPPPWVRKVIIAADHDFADDKGNRAGHIAAQALQEKLLEKGIEVEIAMPDREGDDWNQVLLDQASNKRDKPSGVTTKLDTPMKRKKQTASNKKPESHQVIDFFEHAAKAISLTALKMMSGR
ncbi:DUF7146 domain-containing protein [Motilimonas pumila]|uniref:Uncharacterized protein n=1 Tax=Motilimonas pumila TaxID=2303987 RepID=A0A418YA23_9GAMM|nr:toprim domain-containing protein [Motilimonas pumila]RJG38787.1 hypothetical protein D1Z90_18760 [Motilimonas pumila]